MREYPGVLPWHVDGVVGFTGDELLVLLVDQNERWKRREETLAELRRARGG